MAKNPPENIPIVLFCFDFWKQTCIILLPVGCDHDLTNLQHKRACQRTSALFCVGDQSRCNCTYGMLLFLSYWSIITDIIASIMMISWRYREQKIVNEYSPMINTWSCLYWQLPHPFYNDNFNIPFYNDKHMVVLQWYHVWKDHKFVFFLILAFVRISSCSLVRVYRLMGSSAADGDNGDGVPQGIRRWWYIYPNPCQWTLCHAAHVSNLISLSLKSFASQTWLEFLIMPNGKWHCFRKTHNPETPTNRKLQAPCRMCSPLFLYRRWQINHCFSTMA